MRSAASRAEILLVPILVHWIQGPVNFILFSVSQAGAIATDSYICKRDFLVQQAEHHAVRVPLCTRWFRALFNLVVLDSNAACARQHQRKRMGLAGAQGSAAILNAVSI